MKRTSSALVASLTLSVGATANDDPTAMVRYGQEDRSDSIAGLVDEFPKRFAGPQADLVEITVFLSYLHHSPADETLLAAWRQSLPAKTHLDLQPIGSTPGDELLRQVFYVANARDKGLEAHDAIMRHQRTGEEPRNDDDARRILSLVGIEPTAWTGSNATAVETRADKREDGRALGAPVHGVTLTNEHGNLALPVPHLDEWCVRQEFDHAAGCVWVVARSAEEAHRRAVPVLRSVFPTSPRAGPVETFPRTEYQSRAGPRDFTAGVRLKS